MTTRSHQHLVVAALVAALVSVGTAACSDGPPNELSIDRAWARATPAGATNGAVYLTITSPTDDAITGVEVPASVARGAEMHTAMAGDDGGSMANMPGMDHDQETSMNTMRPLRTVDLPAGEAVAFEPGGRHVMLTDLGEPLREGASFTLTVHLRRGGDRKVAVPVRTNPA